MGFVVGEGQNSSRWAGVSNSFLKEGTAKRQPND